MKFLVDVTETCNNHFVALICVLLMVFFQELHKRRAELEGQLGKR
jgi:hypothetical protein